MTSIPRGIAIFGIVLIIARLRPLAYFAALYDERFSQDIGCQEGGYFDSRAS